MLASVRRTPAYRLAEGRREDRTVCQGEVHLAPDKGAAILGEFLDVSSGGFRASYRERSLATGTEVHFRHRFFEGRARVIWSNAMTDGSHSGFLVLRD
jgi:hypothetical protein